MHLILAANEITWPDVAMALVGGLTAIGMLWALNR